jgi:hypothetical protein
MLGALHRIHDRGARVAATSQEIGDRDGISVQEGAKDHHGLRGLGALSRGARDWPLDIFNSSI